MHISVTLHMIATQRSGTTTAVAVLAAFVVVTRDGRVWFRVSKSIVLKFFSYEELKEKFEWRSNVFLDAEILIHKMYLCHNYVNCFLSTQAVQAQLN